MRLWLGGQSDRQVDVALNRRYGVVFRDGRGTVHKLSLSRRSLTGTVRRTPCHQFLSAAECYYPLSAFDADRLVACSRCFG